MEQAKAWYWYVNVGFQMEYHMPFQRVIIEKCSRRWYHSIFLVRTLNELGNSAVPVLHAVRLLQVILLLQQLLSHLFQVSV